jgi:hypothetical protein
MVCMHKLKFIILHGGETYSHIQSHYQMGTTDILQKPLFLFAKFSLTNSTVKLSVGKRDLWSWTEKPAACFNCAIETAHHQAQKVLCRWGVLLVQVYLPTPPRSDMEYLLAVHPVPKPH